jgi:uncharacterized protein
MVVHTPPETGLRAGMIRRGALPSVRTMSNRTVPWREVSFFLTVTMGAAWLTALPLWTSDVTTEDRAFLLVSIGTMLTPAFATALTTWFFRPPDGIARSTGLLRPRRLRTFSVLGFSYPITAAALALPLGILAGVAHLDLGGLSGLRSLGEDWFGLDQNSPTHTVLLAAIAATTVLFVVGLIPCFGEEWGWRGYLIPRLLPLGVWPALLLSGALWAFWHAPLVLRGFNYDSTGLTGMAEMTVSCMLAGIVLGWLDIRSGSVWPAVVAHSSNNTFAVLITTGIGTDAAVPVDPLLTQIPVWTVTALLVLVLHRTGRLTRTTR